MVFAALVALTLLLMRMFTVLLILTLLVVVTLAALFQVTLTIMLPVNLVATLSMKFLVSLVLRGPWTLFIATFLLTILLILIVITPTFLGTPSYLSSQALAGYLAGMFYRCPRKLVCQIPRLPVAHGTSLLGLVA